ncbi:MAG: hypothetical protein JSR45_05215 [Proteobacteria bacterium]|nr:hypothetical protein [Pseudomonadota bacterium]
MMSRVARFRFAAVVLAAAGLAVSTAPASADPLIRAAFHPSFKGTVGVCLLVDPRAGSVLDARVVEPSGNPTLDASVGLWAPTLTVPKSEKADARPEWLPMYASFEGAREKSGLPDCKVVSQAQTRVLAQK